MTRATTFWVIRAKRRGLRALVRPLRACTVATTAYNARQKQRVFRALAGFARKRGARRRSYERACAYGDDARLRRAMAKWRAYHQARQTACEVEQFSQRTVLRRSVKVWHAASRESLATKRSYIIATKVCCVVGLVGYVLGDTSPALCLDPALRKAPASICVEGVGA